MTNLRPVQSIRESAARFRLVVAVDECRDYVIRGKHGDISEYGSGLLSACFCGPTASKTRTRRINLAIRDGIGKVQARGDDEAQFVLNPADETHVTWFIWALGIRRKRQIAESQKARLRQLSEAHSPFRKGAPSSRKSSSRCRRASAIHRGEGRS